MKTLVVCAGLTLLAVASAGWLSDSVKFAPIYKFDGSSKDYCYPDKATKSNDGTCRKDLSSKTPSYVQYSKCDGMHVYTYWLWYGKQKDCFLSFGEHGNDWEHVSVFVKDDKLVKVIFYQHSGHYTRRRDKLQKSGERPVVYIGKVAHGSYHEGCNGKCSFSSLFTKGCLGDVKYCQGGCGYWDDYRNPGPQFSAYRLVQLQPGQTIDGIKRPDRDICVKSCKGASTRALTTAGCWKDKP